MIFLTVMPNEFPVLELASYLRLNRASPGEWLAAAKVLSGCDDLECRPHGNPATIGAIASLEVEGGSVTVLHATHGFDLSGCRNIGPKMVLPLSGVAEFSVLGRRWQPLDGLAIVYPHALSSIRMAPESQLLIVRPDPGLSVGNIQASSRIPALEVTRLLEHYLNQARFFRDHRHAESQTASMLCTLVGLLCGDKPDSMPGPQASDRRVLRVIEKIDGDANWEFDLKELAMHSGVSERNLYYLMKRQTGMTPYRYFQRSRLIRVRRRLVDCQCETPHISWYAADEGFTHLGRFAALYREHFGELPSETVQWRRRLLDGQEVPVTSEQTAGV